MRSIESEGDSIDEAIERALQVLQEGRDRVAVEILSDATRGVFGFGGKKARVRATIRAPLDEAGAVPRDTILDRAPSSSRADQSERASFRSATPSDRGETAAGVERSLNELGEHAGKVLETLLGYLGASSRVEVEIGGDPAGVTLHVTGDGGGLIIGRRGQTLDALEYLVNRIASRGREGVGRIMIDVEHYRERRREHLEQLAHRLAKKARQTGRPVTLNPMSPRDRRIVHLALQQAGDVTTRSQGEGVFRKITIVPSQRSTSPRTSSP